MNIRDNTAVCGYCGEKVEHQPGKAAAGGGDQKFAGVAGSQAGLKPVRPDQMNPKQRKKKGVGSLQFSSLTNRCLSAHSIYP